MPTKPKENERNEIHAISSQEAGTGETSMASAARHEDTRRRAYEIYLERREEPGHELDDWLQAERELENGVLSQAS